MKVNPHNRVAALLLIFFMMINMLVVNLPVYAEASVAPTLISAGTDATGAVIEAKFDKAMADPSSSKDQFTVNNGTADPVTAATLKTGDATVIVLTLTNAIQYGQTVTIAYTAGTVTSADTGSLAAFTAHNVINNVPQSVTIEAPILASASTNADGTQIEVKFSKVMADPTGKQAQFTVNNGTADPVTAAAPKTGDATVIVLTLTNAIQYGQTVTVAYSSGTVASADTGTLATFTAQTVTNNVPAAPKQNNQTSSITISAARTQATGNVIVTGVVTYVSGSNHYIQDSTAGINVYGAGLTANQGDQITVSGTLKDFNGLLEITTPTIDANISGSLPEPKIINIANANTGNYESQLVIIKNVTLGATSGNYTPVTETTNTINIYKMPTLTGIQAGDTVDIIAIASDYNGAQLLVRSASDITKSVNLPTSPSFVSAATDAAGLQIGVKFDKAMADPTGKHAQFTVNNGAANPVTAAALKSGDATVIMLTLTNAILNAQPVTVAYTAGAAPVTAADTSVLATFTAQTVNNTVAAPGANDKVIVNQVYGDGGDYGVTGAPVSNSFVELYNPTDHDINLTGWSLQYLPTLETSSTGSNPDATWRKLDLVGTIPSHCSFLVKGKAALNPGTINLNLSTITPDQDWTGQSFHNKGLEMVILKNTNLLTVKNPFNTDGNGTKADGYVDMLGVAGNDNVSINGPLLGCETASSQVQSKQKALRRIEFADTDNNAADFEIIGYNSAYIVPWAKPRTVSEGTWTTSGVKPVATNETTLDPLKPNTLTNTFAGDAQTTREFTWQNPVTVTTGQVELIENTSGATFPNANAQVLNATRTEETNKEGSIAVYRAAVTGLKPGTSYLYRAGNGNGWSNVFSFTTEANDNHSFTFLHASDTQAVTKADYSIWGKAVAPMIIKYPDTSFIIETGDLIDTTDREDEWRSFFLACPDVFGNYAFMPVVGNHEQINGNEAVSFRQHFTVPANGASSPVTPGTTYSFDYGDAHFAVLNSESDLTTEKAWLDNDLSKTSKKWKIVATHRGIYEANGISTTLLDAFGSILDKYGVDLVLQGNEHVYMKSFKMKNGQVSDTGTIHLESGGAGSKQDSAGTKLAYQDLLQAINKPTYSAITVTKDALMVDTQDYNSTSKSIEEINTFTLTKADPDKIFDIVEITDLHGNIGDTTATNQVAAVLAENIKNNVYANNPDRTLILSAGDSYQGTAISNLQYGESVMKVLNAIGLNASALGNHEFDWSLEKVTNVNGSKITANYPTVCANLFLKGTTTPVFDPYKIFTKDGVKIAVVGGITETTPGIVLAANIANYEIGSNVTYINKYADEARKAGAQIVIALIHEGDNYNNGLSGPIVDITKQLVGVDAVLGGHSHSIAKTLVTTNAGKRVPLEIANYNGKGYIDLKVAQHADGTFTFDNATSAYVAQDTASKVYPYGYKADPLVADQTVQQIVADTITAEGPILDEVLGSAKINMTRTQADSPYGESLAGNWAADVTRIRGNAEIGFQNNGGLRCDITQGQLTMSNIYQFMPFDNVVMTCDMTGAQLKTILEEAVMDKGMGIQLSGLKFTYNPSQPSGNRVIGITKSDGTPIDINDTIKTYTVATNDFLAGGTTASPKDGFTFASQSSNMTNTYVLVRDALADAVKAAGATGINAQIEGRIKNSTKVNTPLASTVKFAVFSDPHYFAPELGTSGAAFDQYLASDRKMIAESKAILESTVAEIKNSDAQIVLVAGDLTKDGEYVSETQFAGYLQQLKDAGKKVYVINGNHDIDNPNALSYSGANTTKVKNTTAADFKIIYDGFGYGDAVAVDTNSLSYVVDPVPGLRIIAMDACVYGQTAGTFSADRQTFIDKWLVDGTAKGMTVIGMMHHGINNHFSLESTLFPEYVIKNADAVAADLSSKGMKAVFTGHFHAQDIAKSASGLFDIETGSLVTYPVPYRLAELNPDGSLNVTSQRINSISYNTGGKSFPNYAKDFLVQGLNGLVPQMLAGIIMQQHPEMSASDAMATATNAAAQPLTPTLTVKDCLINAMVAHYQGDEQCDPQLLAAYQGMAASADTLTKTLGGALLSLNTDLAPGDNSTNLNLITGVYTQPVLAAPQVVSAASNQSGTKVLVKFDKIMADPTGKQAEFSIVLNTTANAVVSVDISPADSTTIALTLTNPVVSGNVITVAYTKGTVKSSDGVVLESVKNLIATNNTAADSVSKVTATINGDPSTSEGFTWYTGTVSAASDLQLVEKVGQNPDFSQALQFTGLYSVSTNKASQRVHKAKATGLKPGTTYSYRVGDAFLGIWSEIGTFTTAPASGAFTFIDLADTQAKSEDEAILSSETIAKALDTVDDAKFVALNGDVVDTGSNEGQWDWMLGHSQTSLLNTTIVAAAGNHEKEKNSYIEHFDIKAATGSDTTTGAYYSYDYSNAHFLVLNNNENSTEYADFSTAQIEWMKADVAAAKAAGSKWIIAIMHKGPYTTSNHATDPDIMGANGIRTKIAPIMDNLGIDLVLQGHDHIYARSKPIKADSTADNAYKITETFNGQNVEYTVNPDGTIYLIPNTAGAKVYYKNKTIDPSYFNLFDVADEHHAAPYGADPTDASRPVRSQIQNFESITVDGDKLTVLSYEIDQSKNAAQPYLIDSFGITKQAEAVPTKPKNVIFLIGDGMGYEQIKAARDADADHHLAMDDVNTASGSVTTRSADAAITDSAPAATALASGYKANNNWIGLTPDKTVVPTILEIANQDNKATGLVTTTQICHATPAGFASHVVNRNTFNTIAAQYYDNFAGKGKPLNVLMGAGANNFTSSGRPAFYASTGNKYGDQNDTRDLVGEFTAQGYAYANDAASLASINTTAKTNILGLFGPDSGMTQELVRQTGNTEPHLVDMTKKALDALSSDPDGFFLMVEGGQIDWAAHANDLNNTVGETLAFDKCVQTALEFQVKHPDTLVVVTADHETGGLSYTDATHVTWSSGDHTAAMVPIMAKGPGASAFSGDMDNTEIPRKMATAMELDKPLVVQYSGTTVGQPTTFTVTSMGAAVEGANVSVKDASKDNLTLSTITADASGKASYTVTKAGNYIISASKNGYMDSTVRTINSVVATVGATIKSLSVADSNQQPITTTLTKGQQYYLKWKANKNSDGTMSGLAIVEVLDANNQATFLNAARLQVPNSPDAEYSALFQPSISGTYKIKGFFWNDWSNTASWQSQADPVQTAITVN